ncbi:flavin reductase family protein [Paradevosia shaoguanensis]|uniref:flavin reductase family protein n=1 Tax=Paradevosia shaoguanensis TaxID=1335043 RepID=UPI003C7574D3
MPRDMHYYEPANGHGLRHDPFNAIVAPRPIGWISSMSAAGHLNLAPFSFFNAFNYVPPIVGFATVGPKDTLANVRETKEFCWNLATRPLAEAMNATSASVAREVDEFALSGLTPQPSSVVTVPHVAEAPVVFECRMSQIVQLKTAAGADVPTWVTFGEVVAVHIERSLISEGVYQTAAAQPIMRAGGRGDYFELRPEGYFEMIRPR